MTTVYWNDVNHADYAVGSKHTVGGQTLIVAGHGPAGVVLTENGEMPPSHEEAVGVDVPAEPVPTAEPGAME